MKRGDLISYMQMCTREGASLQRGMNFRLGDFHSVVLMSTRSNAPYADRVEDEGSVLIYEGHDLPRSRTLKNPKSVDQPEFLDSGKSTQNGLFKRAVEEFKKGQSAPEIVRVYDKLYQGVWAYNGAFDLVDWWAEASSGRQVFKFKLALRELDAPDGQGASDTIVSLSHERLIPSAVKVEVWKRDKGKCVKCGSDKNLHFDHIIPFSKGGTSLSARNIQLLCMRHNLAKSDKIQ